MTHPAMQNLIDINAQLFALVLTVCTGTSTSATPTQCERYALAENYTYSACVFLAASPSELAQKERILLAGMPIAQGSTIEWDCVELDTE